MAFLDISPLTGSACFMCADLDKFSDIVTKTIYYNFFGEATTLNPRDMSKNARRGATLLHDWHHKVSSFIKVQQNARNSATDETTNNSVKGHYM